MFLFILALILLPLNLMYIKLIQHQKIEYHKGLLYQEEINNFENKEIDFAFFGSSHASKSIHPAYITGSYNFALNHGTYVETYYKLKNAVEKDDLKINHIVLELDLHDFSEKYNKPKEIFRNLEISQEYATLREIAEIREESWSSVVIQRYFPILGNAPDLIEYVKDKPTFTPTYFGGEISEGDFSQAENKTFIAYQRYKLHFDKDSAKLSSISILYLIKTLQYAQEHNIMVIFIRYPITTEFDEITQKNVPTEKYYSTVFSYINKTVGEDYAVLDYHDLFFDKPELFYDPDHLNHIGAEIFSKKVADDLTKSAGKE